MIYDRWNHFKAPPKKPPLLSYNIIRPDTNFLTSSPKSAPSKTKTQRNGITCMQLNSPKMPLSKKNTRSAPPPSQIFLSCGYLCIFQQANADDCSHVILWPSPLKCQQNTWRFVYFRFTALSQVSEVMHIYWVYLKTFGHPCMCVLMSGKAQHVKDPLLPMAWVLGSRS